MRSAEKPMAEERPPHAPKTPAKQNRVHHPVDKTSSNAPTTCCETEGTNVYVGPLTLEIFQDECAEPERQVDEETIYVGIRALVVFDSR